MVGCRFVVLDCETTVCKIVLLFKTAVDVETLTGLVVVGLTMPTQRLSACTTPHMF